MIRLILLALVGGLFGLDAVLAQDPPPPVPKVVPVRKAPRPDVPLMRAQYAVRHANPDVLATTVERLFAADDVTVVLATTGSGATVLVSGPTKVVPEVTKLLEQLDQKPRSVEIEIAIIDGVALKDGQEPKAAELLKTGKGQRTKLTTVEGQTVSSTAGGNRPFTTGSTASSRPSARDRGTPPGGFPPSFTTRSVNYLPVGTTIKLSARIGSNDHLTIELNLQNTKVHTGDDSVPEASTENGTLTTSLNVASGEPVIAQAIRTDGKDGATASYVIITARTIASPSATSR